METLTLTLPDWSQYDSLVQSELPFVLWPVGDQPLLYHWLDYVVNEGINNVKIICSDRPAQVRQYMKQATLWPIEWEIESIPRTQPTKGTEWVARLPWQQDSKLEITDSWALMDYWFSLQNAWFDYVKANEEVRQGTFLIGRFCSIHPTVKIRLPVWIGDYVSIGPGSVIGPYVSIGEGAVLEGPSSVKHSIIAPQTYLAGNTELINSYLIGSMLINLKHRACITHIDPIIADGMVKDTGYPSLLERAFAGILGLCFNIAGYFLSSKTIRSWKSFRGDCFYEEEGPLWYARRSWFWNVFRGKMRLLGTLPRTEQQYRELTPEWQNIIANFHDGVFAYSDLYGCHSADQAHESIHAVYQATQSEKMINKRLVRQILKLMRTRLQWHEKNVPKENEQSTTMNRVT